LDGSAPILVKCTISENDAGSFGGGVQAWNASPELISCTIAGNSGYEAGGGVDCGPNSSVTLMNCILAGNEAIGGGGASCDWSSSLTLTNCTISGNRDGFSSASGDLECTRNSSMGLTNCIVWSEASSSIYASEDCSIQINYSCVRGSEPWPGAGNVNRDPRFIEPGRWDDNRTPDNWGDDIWIHGNYQLQPGSPCMDRGTAIGMPTFDIDGNGRPCGAGVDLGAFEAGNCASLAIRFLRGNSDGLGTTDITDVIFTLSYLFLGGPEPPCLDAADADDTGIIDITDSVFLLTFLFLGGPHPGEPFGECGIDPTIDDLSCVYFAHCQ